MIGLIQRVSQAEVSVEGQVTGSIERGILLLLGVESGDDSAKVDRLIDKVLGYRIFPDDAGRMNLSLKDIGGQLLVVSQFTLAAETTKGMRPGFSRGASPDLAQERYRQFIDGCRSRGVDTQSGRFGADMAVSLVNDGPVTFWLQV